MSQAHPQPGRAAAALLLAVLLGACAGTQPKNVEADAAGHSTALPPAGLNLPTFPPGTVAIPLTPGGTPTTRATTRATNPARRGGGGTATTRPPAAPPAVTSPSIPGFSSTTQGNGGATDVGITADTIKLGGFYSESGPQGMLGLTLLRAARAVFNEVNDQGGIFGRQIQLIDCDTGGTAGERPKSCFTKLTEEDKIFALAAAGDGAALVTGSPLLCVAQIPAFGLDGLAAEEFRCPTIFPVGPPARSQSHVLTDYYVKTHRPKTVGFLVQNDDIGNQWRDGAKTIFERAGVTVVTEQRYDIGDSNLNPQVIAMQAAAPDFVYFAGEPRGGIAFQIQARTLGYKPPKPSAGVTCNAELWPRQVGDYSKGMVCAHPWKLPQAGLPEHAAFEQTYKKYWNDWDQRTAATELHWAAAKSVVEALRQVGPNLTRARLLDALRGGAIDGFDTGFGVKFKQQASDAGGHAFDTQVAVIEITAPAGIPAYYEMRQDPIPDPLFTVK